MAPIGSAVEISLSMDYTDSSWLVKSDRAVKLGFLFIKSIRLLSITIKIYAHIHTEYSAPVDSSSDVYTRRGSKNYDLKRN